ncbi:DUF494 family protein [Legionella oakridgensis]|uniref:Protein Smg homolog n=2 Tax=Legionella oakridgensis TaxID=29423 RepID=W0BC21_9GAMM|nr:DUF494 family protein [Legionella oakridgensis]AHE66172.1 hypothetical protein Loa_00602 [Legionella oakridgensis ATCC 33761 = DSM 21215]ETO94035.1 hypothetical protein LOR_52c10350 [Legionella oakridgensis RV-2-2007]KTD43912.1 hypothetical protein Loak_0462 [Legionella oakridgensis]STY16080.1 Uncharacterized protein conserved in bacteria [Legionella longbeachae]
MKDSLFEMLLSLFEKTLNKLKENHATDGATKETIKENLPDLYTSSLDIASEDLEADFFKSARADSMRVFTYDEQMKFTKASYQFLMRLLVWEIIDRDTLELIINQLVFSDSRIVSLEETKWTVRSVLADTLNTKQLAFLDLVLYQKRDGYSLH